MNNFDKITELLEQGVSIGYALKQVCGNQAICIPFDDEDVDVPLESLRLSTRSYNSLKREKLNTLKEVIERFGEQGWRDIKNFGKTSAMEVFDKIIEVAWNNMNDTQKKNFLASTNYTY